MGYSCERPFFSIIVPIYNKKDYLRQCINSVLEQSCLDFELILVDDGSTDSSPQICDEYAAVDTRIKVVHKNNGGLVSARKAGANNATGDYILNLDADDYMSHMCLQTVFEIVKTHNPDIVAFKCSRFNSDNELSQPFGFTTEKGFYTEEKLEQLKSLALYNQDKPWYIFGVAPNLCFKAIKSSLYKKWQQNTLDSIIMGEDLSVFFPCLTEAESVYLLDDVLYYYRDYNDSITSVYRDNEYENLEILITYLESVIDTSKNNLMMQICSYVSYRVHEININIAKNSESYKIFKQRISALPEKLFCLISKFKLTTFNRKSWLVTNVLKHRFWMMYWFMYHR